MVHSSYQTCISCPLLKWYFKCFALMKPVCNRGLLVNGIFSLYSNCMHAHVATSWKKIVLKILILALRQRHSYLMEMMIYICFVFSARFMTFPTLTLPRESCIPEETILRKHKYRFFPSGTPGMWTNICPGGLFQWIANGDLHH